MIRIDREHCTACGACAQICPADCIYIKADESGFSYPEIDTAACLSCGACERVCPIGREVAEKHPVAYAAVTRDQADLMRETSGGAFGAIARKIIADGGVVYGCAYGNGLTVTHIRIEDAEALPRLFGSKYVQSDTNTTFRRVKADLGEGRRVFYSGTPCQIAGLYAYLGRMADDENLLTADLICHGVPPQTFFADYLRHFEEKHGVTLDEMAFRTKGAGPSLHKGTYSGHCLGTRKGKDRPFKCSVSYYDSYYYFYFLQGAIYRESCYSCQYATLTRTGDFTLGDLWGAEGLSLPFSAAHGCSLVLANTEKAQKLLPALDLHACEVDLAYAAKYNKQLREPSKKPANRDTLLARFATRRGEDIHRAFLRENRAARLKGRLKYAVPAPMKGLLLKMRYKKKRNV